MDVAHRRTDLWNRIGGFLGGYFTAAFCIFLFLTERWAHQAPAHPVQVLGQLYAHNEHGWTTYFTAFQSTSGALMFWSNFFAVGLAMSILPKREIKVRRLGRLPLAASWKRDDENGFARKGAAYGLVTAPLVIFLFGPIIVSWLNGHGVVFSL